MVMLANNLNKDNHTIELIDSILVEAVQCNASDIHFEPYINNYRIRFRVDGILEEMGTPNPNLANRLAARLKIMANLDISEKRLPQDGRFTINLLNSSRECRINTCPTLHGEKIAIRILNPSNLSLKIHELGLENKQETIFIEKLHRPQGMILVTGPTGSGKTVTLYSGLSSLNSIRKNISTVEDPVEIDLPGINQVNIKPKIGLDFSIVLRSFLRQDPDIIMVGEIRDFETADIAIKAAQTGHLVLATLHTNSATDAINRLLNMGITSFNLHSAISLIIGQRLLRKLCPRCKQITKIPDNLLIEEGFSKNELAELKLYKAKGCTNCNNGYRGRTGIFELLPLSESTPSPNVNKNNLVASALNKIRKGVTTLEETNRVL